MANRRMFSKTITRSSKFLRMSSDTRLLYYELGMDADDDGFVEWYAVITMTRASEQDLQVLHANGFVQVFDDKVLLVADWKENNYLRPDRYTPSKYLSVYSDQIGKDLVYQTPTTGIPLVVPVVDQRYTQDRIGKDREGKDRIGKDTTPSAASGVKGRDEFIEGLQEGTKRIWKYWEEVRPEITTDLEGNRAAINRLIDLEGSPEKVERLIQLTAKAWDEKYAPKEAKASSPRQLWEKRAALLSWGKGKFSQQEKTKVVSIS